MKTKVAFLTFLATAVISSVWAQSTEDDDMYFTSKDRAALNAAQSAAHQEVLASTSSRRIIESEVASVINPTDSYSARNVNPEYISGSKVGSNSTAGVQYFSPTYQPIAVNQNLASNNCNCNNTYNGFNNGYGYNRFGSYGSPYGMGSYGYNSYGMMNPYSNFYGGYGYSPYSMIGSGFYGSGLSFGFGSGFGNSFGYGSPFGFGNSYYGMNSYYGGYNSFYNPYRYGGYSYAAIDNGYYSYGRRPSNIGSSNYYNSSSQGVNSRSGRDVSNGRSNVATNGAASSTYYDRGWRQSSNGATRGTWDNSGNNNRGWNNTNSGGRQSTWSNDGGFRNSSFNNGGFSGGRSSSFGGGGGFSGGGGGGSAGGRGGRH